MGRAGCDGAAVGPPAAGAHAAPTAAAAAAPGAWASCRMSRPWPRQAPRRSGCCVKATAGRTSIRAHPPLLLLPHRVAPQHRKAQAAARAGSGGRSGTRIRRTTRQRCAACWRQGPAWAARRGGGGSGGAWATRRRRPCPSACRRRTPLTPCDGAGSLAAVLRRRCLRSLPRTMAGCRVTPWDSGSYWARRQQAAKQQQQQHL